MRNLAFTAPDYTDVGTCAQALGSHVVGFRPCGRTARVKGTIVGDSRVLSFCGMHAKAPNVTILETLSVPVSSVQAVKLCCTNGHTGRYARGPVRDGMIIPLVKASIAYCDERADECSPKVASLCRCGERFAAAADRLRDFATVELLCADLGITRKDLN